MIKSIGILAILFFSLQGGFAAAPVEQVKPRNVLIIGADTLRADHLGLYGYKLPTSPNLDALAGRAVVFERAFAQGSYTLPSFASFFTSRYPEQHGAFSQDSVIQASETTLAELFQKQGYRTAAFTGGPNVSALYGFGKGFDSYLGGDQARNLDAYVPAALQWMKKDSSRPFLLFLQPQDVHPPFDLLGIPEGERNRFDPEYAGPADEFLGSWYCFRLLNGDVSKRGAGPRLPEDLSRDLEAVRKDPRAWRHMSAVYDDRVAHLDKTMGAFLKRLQDLGILDQTIVVFMGDHGTLWGEGGNFGHGIHASTKDGIFHVPLILWIPGQAPRRVPEVVELVDVAPTLLELAGFPVPQRFAGTSLLPLIAGRPGPARQYAFGTAAILYPGSPHRLFVRDFRWKLVREADSTVSLYDLFADPGEDHDVSAAHPDIVERLSDALLRHMRDIGKP